MQHCPKTHELILTVLNIIHIAVIQDLFTSARKKFKQGSVKLSAILFQEQLHK